MAATYTIKVSGVRTHDLGSLTKVVKQIEFTVEGAQDTQTFALPQTLTVPDADASSFVPFEQLTEANVVAWINEHFENLDSVKAHIQFVLDKESQKAQLAQQPLPWAPPPPATPTAPPPAAQ
jgi:hypothetical protein